MDPPRSQRLHGGFPSGGIDLSLAARRRRPQELKKNASTDFKAAAVSRAGKAVTSSLKVAAAFGLTHCYMFKRIREMPCSQELREKHVIEGRYQSQRASGPRPMFFLTRPAFDLITSRFRGLGRGGLAWRRRRFHAAFEAVERTLTGHDESGR